MDSAMPSELDNFDSVLVPHCLHVDAEVGEDDGFVPGYCACGAEGH